MRSAARRIVDENVLGIDQTGDEPLEPALLAALDESDEQLARGDVVPVEVLFADFDRIVALR